MKHWWNDVCLAVGHSMKIQIKGKYTIVLLALGLLLMTTMLVTLEEAKEEKSRIAIGIADNDNSVLSEKLRKEVAKLDLYEVTEGTEKELVSLLRENRLSAVCVITKGYEASVLRGEERNLITIYESKQSEALLVGDILAGILMQDICQAKGYLTLLEYREKYGITGELSYEAYKEYAEMLFAEGGMEFSFRTDYVSVEGELQEKPAQSLVYLQGIFAVFALMVGILSFYAVLPFWEMLYGPVGGKLRTLPTGRMTGLIGNGLASFLLPSVFAVLFLGIVAVKQEAGAELFFSFLICTETYVCGIVGIILAAACLIRNKTVYQMGILVMIVLFGVAGFVSVVEGLFLPEGMTSWIPNSRYVKMMTELISYKG